MPQDYQKRIKELEEEVKRLQDLVVQDELTGALNRKGISEKLEVIFKEVIYLQANPESKRHFHLDNLAVIFIDIDNFKKVNDTYGHSVGDDVLKLVTQSVKEEIREMDLVGRLGGEEFVIALLGATENDAYRKAEAVRKVIEEKVFIPDIKDLKITVSVGVASVQKADVKNMMDLISMADKAMYEAKTNRGKNNVVKYSELL